ncbi:MAG TPA: peptidogalycan biosysnthesis protein, partial [Mesorhizobium sp.]|nr:peptidogalycan biosysnthesis protein [Mesorhizobium sp.]
MDQGDESRRMDDADFAVRVAAGIGAFTEAEWNSLSGTSRTSISGYNPFISYAFLTSLEDSGCAVPRTGWQGNHIRLESADGRLLGAVPCYAKSHSQGEYVFDHGWADALERAGGRYYPKLQCAVPFTPVTGPRLLVAQGEDEATVKATLAAALKAVTDRLDVSSAHITFLPPDDLPVLAAAGFLHRTDQQFHFFNEGFASYDDFLATLASRKRKALKKERREALSAGITIERLTGKAITERAWDDFFAFYMDTGGRKWGRPYLNR